MQDEIIASETWYIKVVIRTLPQESHLLIQISDDLIEHETVNSQVSKELSSGIETTDSNSIATGSSFNLLAPGGFRSGAKRVFRLVEAPFVKGNAVEVWHC